MPSFCELIKFNDSKYGWNWTIQFGGAARLPKYQEVSDWREDLFHGLEKKKNEVNDFKDLFVGLDSKTENNQASQIKHIDEDKEIDFN